MCGAVFYMLVMFDSDIMTQCWVMFLLFLFYKQAVALGEAYLSLVVFGFLWNIEIEYKFPFSEYVSDLDSGAFFSPEWLNDFVGHFMNDDDFISHNFHQ